MSKKDKSRNRTGEHKIPNKETKKAIQEALEGINLERIDDLDYFMHSI